MVTKDHLPVFHSPCFCTLVSVSFLSGRIMQLIQWQYICVYIRKKEEREREKQGAGLCFHTTQNFPVGLTATRPARTGIHQCLLTWLGCLSWKCIQLWFCVVLNPYTLTKKAWQGVNSSFRAEIFLLREMGRATFYYLYLFSPCVLQVFYFLVEHRVVIAVTTPALDQMS